MKRKREVEKEISQQEVVAAALRGDAEELGRLLGLAESSRQRRRRTLLPERVSRPFAGCTPLAAAVLGGNPAVIKLLSAEVDVNQLQLCRLDEAAMRAAFPELSKRKWMEIAFRRGSVALHSALRLGLFASADALLDVGAGVNQQELHRDTPLCALNTCLMFDRRGPERPLPEGGPMTRMLHRLLEAGADPAQPEEHPFLSSGEPEIVAAAVAWLLQAHDSGRRQLSTDLAVLCLQSAMQTRNLVAYPCLLAVLQPRREQLDSEALLQLLAVAARYGTPAMLRDMLALGADPTAPAAARLCLLAQAALQREAKGANAMVQALLAAKAQLRVHDICCCAATGNATALARLLPIGTPQPSTCIPWLVFRTDPCSYILSRDFRLSCPVLVNLEYTASTLQSSYAVSDSSFMLGQVRHRLDVAEALGAAGYRPTVYGGASRLRDLAVGGGDVDSEEEEDGPWQLDPLHDEPPRRFAAQGANRLLMVALERPQLGPGTLHRFPLRLQAAVRTMLLIAQHGKTLADEDGLTAQQLAVLCCYRRQQLYQRLDQLEEGEERSLTGLMERLNARRLRAWAAEHGWASPRERERLAAKAAAEAAAGAAQPASQRLQLAAAAARDRPTTVASFVRQVHARRQLAEDERLAGILQPRGARDSHLQLASYPEDPQLAQLQASERRLNERLLGNGMALPELPLAAHPMRRLPADVLLHILQLAAYPLSAWAGEEGDFGPSPEEAAGPEAELDTPYASPPASP